MPDNNVIDRLGIEITAGASGAVNQIKSVTTALDGLSKSLSRLNGVKINSFISKSAITNINDLGSALKSFDIARTMVFTDAVSSLGKVQVKSFVSDAAINQIRDLGDAIKGFDAMTSSAFASAMNGLASVSGGTKFSLSAATANAVRSLGDAIRSWEGLDLSKLRELSSMDFSNLAPLTDLSSRIRGLSHELESLQKQTKEVESRQRKLKGSLDGSKSSVKSLGNESHKSTGKLANLLNSIKRIAFYRIVRSAIKEVTEGFKEGIENLYYWSQAWNTSFAPAMDQLATAQQYLKNGFASMFSPLIEYAIPAIDALIDKFVEFFNFVQEGFAQITGAATWNKARKIPVQYADALDNATNSAKELKHQLLGFDELNVLNTPSDSSRGSNKDEKDYSSMFELVETAAGNNFDNLGSRLADSLNGAFDEPEKWGEWGEKIAGWVSTAFNNALSFFEDVNWENIGSSLSTFVTRLATELANKIKDRDWGEVVLELTNAICGIIEGVELNQLIGSLAKLVASIATAIPSVFLASLEGGLDIISTILRKLGLEGAADTVSGWSGNLDNVRKEYEKARGVVLDELFQYIDGTVPELSDEDAKNRALVPDGAVWQGNGSTSNEEALTGLEKYTEIFEAWDDILGLVQLKWESLKKSFEESQFYQRISQWITDNKDEIGQIVQNAKDFARDVKEIYEKNKPWIDKIIEAFNTHAFTTFFDSLTNTANAITPVVTAISGVVELFSAFFDLMNGDQQGGLRKIFAAFGKFANAIYQTIVWPITAAIDAFATLVEVAAVFLPDETAKKWRGFAENVRGVSDSIRGFGDTMEETIANWGVELTPDKYYNPDSPDYYQNLPKWKGGASGGGHSFNAAGTMKVSLDNIIEAPSIVDKVSEKWDEFTKWWADKKAEIKLWPTDVKAKVKAKWDTFTTWWANKKAEIKLWSADIKAKVLAKWNTFTTWWKDRKAEIKLWASDIKAKVLAKWNTFTAWWKDKKAEIKLWPTDIKAKVLAKWNTFTAWWKDRKAEIKLWATDIKAKVLAKWSEFTAWWVGKKAEIKLWATDIKAKVLAKWNTFTAWWAGKKAEIKLWAADIKTKVTEKWNAFTTWWSGKTAEIKLWATDITSKVAAKWTLFTTWWSGKSAEIKLVAQNIKAKVSEKWDAFVTWWAGKKEEVKLTVGSLIGKVAIVWNELKEWLSNKVMEIKFRFKALFNSGSKDSGSLELDQYASGGFPAPSGLFLAGEGGVPELLGTIGGRTAVAGGAEITGIRDAIENQGAAERQLLSQLISAVQSKDLTLVANSSTGRWVNQSLKAYAGVTG